MHREMFPIKKEKGKEKKGTEGKGREGKFVAHVRLHIAVHIQDYRRPGERWKKGKSANKTCHDYHWMTGEVRR